MIDIPEDDVFEKMGVEAVEETEFDSTVQFFASNWLARKKHAAMLAAESGYSATLRREAARAYWTAIAFSAAALLVIGLVVIVAAVMLFRLIH